MHWESEGWIIRPLLLAVLTGYLPVWLQQTAFLQKSPPVPSRAGTRHRPVPAGHGTAGRLRDGRVNPTRVLAQPHP